MGITYKPKHKAKTKIGMGAKLLIFLLILAMLAAGGFAFYTFLLSPTTFLKDSSINGIDVSGLKVDRAVRKLSSTWNGNVVKIMADGKQVDEVTGNDLTYDVDKQVKKCLYPSYRERFERLIDKSRRRYVLDVSVDGTTKNFDEQVESLSIVRNHKITTKTKNARVDLSDTDFNVIKEVYGDELDTDRLKETLIECITSGQETLEYDPGNFYKQPEIKSDSPEIEERLEYCEKYLTRNITILGPGTKYTLTPYDMDRMMTVSDKGGETEYDFNNKKIKKFVNNTLAERFNTVGMTRELKLAGGKVTIAGGNYGYKVDTKKTVKVIRKVLKSGEDAEVDPAYSQKGWGRSKNDDIGDSYIECSISKQHVWCVYEGEQVVSTSCVTGNVKDGNSTPTGVFSIMYTESPSVLKGENNDGTKYETPVSYWMPFYAGCGFHDANWRSKFGGKIYLRDGSHGCVNMPPAQAEILYGYVEAGMPVIVHN